jgi:uracil-DNA glycosylase
VTVPAEGPIPAKVMIVGEAPGEREIQENRPFVGPSGWELDKMLGEVGLNRRDCFITNVVQERPPGNDITKFIPVKKKTITRDMVPLKDRMVLPIVVDGYQALLGEISTVRPNVIIALGNTALWALAGKWGIKNWRGSLLETDAGIRLVPTVHPAAILRQWNLRAIAVQDLRRAAREAGGNGAKKPEWQFLIRPTFSEVTATLNWILDRLDRGPVPLSVDIETSYGHIMCLGIAWSHLNALCIPFVEIQKGGASYWIEHEEAEIVFMLYKILTHPNCQAIWQNGLFDAQYIYRAWHFVPRHHFDTMLGWHSCFSTMPKSLDFISSMLADYHVYWKGVARDLDKSHGEKPDD